jgi:hypothetical protein
MLNFFSSGTQYYVTGRFGVLAHQMPVAGNLIHHAIEMYLKGALAKKMSLEQLRKLSHYLPNLWNTFKENFPSANSDSFDNLVLSLHTFEDIRYPDSVINKGMALASGVIRGTSKINPKPVPDKPAVPVYELYLDEVDSLVDHIFQLASVNPAFFLGGLSQTAREYLINEKCSTVGTRLRRKCSLKIPVLL